MSNFLFHGLYVDSTCPYLSNNDIKDFFEQIMAE